MNIDARSKSDLSFKYRCLKGSKGKKKKEHDTREVQNGRKSGRFPRTQRVKAASKKFQYSSQKRLISRA